MKTTLPALLLATTLLGCLGSARRPPVASLFPMSSLWTTSVGDVIEGPLATDGERVFVATRDGRLRGLDPTDGKIRWEVGGRAGVLSAVPGLLVLKEADGTAWGIDPATGSARWKTETGIRGLLPALINKDVVVVAGEGVAALPLAGGKILWKVEQGAVSAPPVAFGPWIFLGEADGVLRCRDAASGASLWTYKTASGLKAAPVLSGDGTLLLGTTDRRFVSLSTHKGEERWTWKLGADVQTPPAVLRDVVLFATYEDVLYALRRGNGHLAWRALLPSRPLSGPLVHGGAVLVACYGSRPGETFLVGFDGETGERQGDLKSPGEIRTPPLLGDGRVYLGLRENAVTALRVASSANP